MNALKKYNLAFTAYETSATSSFSNSKIMYLCNFIMLQTKSVGNMILSFCAQMRIHRRQPLIAKGE